MSFRPPKGTDDIGAPESVLWRRLLVAWEEMAERYGYPLLITPIFEATELFERGVGGATEVVTKQMYQFTDRGGRSVALRPEGTAGVVRAFLDRGAAGPWKAAYSGPMFRYERPQAGRRRQFWQVGVEYLDVEAPAADAEVVELGYRYLTTAEIPALETLINSLGDPVCRPAYLETLRDYLASRRSLLCDDSLALVDTNPLRVLDCKVCAPVLVEAPVITDFLCEPCSSHYVAVKELLGRLDVPYREEPRLVRGLDYYTRTAFEYIATGLDTAQNAVGGGGRYDGLAESIGGRRAPGVGFALGIDRIALASKLEPGSAFEVYVVTETSPGEALAVASRLRRAGLRTDFDAESRSVKAQFRAAGRSGARSLVVVGEASGELDVRAGEERARLPVDQAIEWLRERIR